MLNGLDLFSGIGGLSLALAQWVRPIAYCENDRFATSVLLSRMRDGSIPFAPIWNDVRTLSGGMVPGRSIDIIYGGFPCQDISVAGLGAGLAGERSGLVSHVFRLADELRPSFIFLENVPAIKTRGGERVGKELAARGYDCRWDIISAAEVGAPHLRKRWFLLAHRDGNGRKIITQRDGQESTGSRPQRHDTNRFRDAIPDTERSERSERGDESGRRGGAQGQSQAITRNDGAEESLANTSGKRWENRDARTRDSGQMAWEIEPDVGRVVNGLPQRVDRIRGLGNAVVPLQAREAFKRLMGLRST